MVTKKQIDKANKGISAIRDLISTLQFDMGFANTIIFDGEIYSRETLDSLADMAEKLDKFINYI